MIDYVMRILRNVFNNVSEAAETPLGEKVVSVIVIIVVGFIICAVASGLGMILASIFKGIGINLAGMLAAVIATFVVLGSTPEKGVLEYIIGGVIILAGLAGVGMTLLFGKEYGWGHCSKKLTEGYAYYYAAFVLSVFAISPQWYEMLPGKINKWCIYVPLFMAGTAAIVAYSKPFVPMNQAKTYSTTVIYYISEAVSTVQQSQEVINMADNEKFTIDRSDLTSGNYDTAEQTAVTTEGEAPVSPPETVIAIILAGLIRSGAVS